MELRKISNSTRQSSSIFNYDIPSTFYIYKQFHTIVFKRLIQFQILQMQKTSKDICPRNGVGKGGKSRGCQQAAPRIISFFETQHQGAECFWILLWLSLPSDCDSCCDQIPIRISAIAWSQDPDLWNMKLSVEGDSGFCDFSLQICVLLLALLLKGNSQGKNNVTG